MTSTTRIDRVNILLVDDQPSKLLTYETILGDLGENLLTASSATEALECLLKNEIAVVLVDVCMPELDGYELAAMIRQHPRFQRTSIIFVSAILMTDLDRLRGYECGAVDYVPVPVVPEILRAKVSVFAELYRKTSALERLNSELEQRVAERTADLQATTSALQEADRRKTQFLAMLAHELRNPLAPIRNAVEILRRSGGDEQKAKPVTEMMQRQVGQMVRLVDDLLDVSRISRVKIELRKQQVELASVVYHAVEAIRPVCVSMDHELTVTLPPQPTYLNADPIRLTQVVGNLLNNACKFTEKGGHIRLTVEREGTQVLVRVQDTGIGIAAEQLPRIFETFVQADTSLERSRDGLGLGLTLVKNLVEMHDGSVEASSAGVGQGSEFVVRLPLLSDVLPPQPREPSRAEPDATVQRRILLVDDNRDAADSVA